MDIRGYFEKIISELETHQYFWKQEADTKQAKYLQALGVAMRSCTYSVAFDENDPNDKIVTFTEPDGSQMVFWVAHRDFHKTARNYGK